MTDDLVKRPDDKQDDLTLVYMWAYKMAEKKYKARIEKLEAALEWIAMEDAKLDEPALWIDDNTPLGLFIDMTLGEKKDD